MRALRPCLLLALSAPLLAQDFERLRFLLPDRVLPSDTPVDFDGDGDLDLLGGGVQVVFPTEVLLFQNDGGKFTEEVLFQLGPGESWSELIPIDVDGDGRLDLLLLSWYYADHLLLQQPDGSFVDTTAPTVGDFWRIDVGDVDGDGDTDLLYSGGSPLASGGLEPNRLLLNDGAGVFSDASGLFPDVVESGALFFDFDGDGDLDILRDASVSANLVGPSTSSSRSAPGASTSSWTGTRTATSTWPRGWPSLAGAGTWGSSRTTVAGASATCRSGCPSPSRARSVASWPGI